MASSTEQQPPPSRCWAGLPHDVLWPVFTALGQREVLSGGAGITCAAWRRVARDEPALWRRIDLTVLADDDDDTKEDYGVELSDDDAYWEIDDGFSEDGQGIFSLFDGYGTGTPIYHEEKIAAKVDDDGDLSGDGILLGLFNDTSLDKEEIPVKNGGTVNEEEELSDDENLSGDDDGGGDVGLNDEHLFDNHPSWEEEIPTNDSSRWKEMALVAIDRSAGQCEAFWGHADDEVLLYLADRAPSMKSLRVRLHGDVSSLSVCAELINKFPLLEELQLVLKSDAYDYTTTSGQPSTNSWVLELFQAACEACSHLHQFTVRRAGKDRRSYSSRDQTERRSPKSLSIPMMHGLHSLEVFGDSFTRDVVMQIVDKCPNLECLNISDVPLDQWDIPVLTHKCSGIKDLVLPAVSYDYYSDESYDDMS